MQARRWPSTESYHLPIQLSWKIRSWARFPKYHMAKISWSLLVMGLCATGRSKWSQGNNTTFFRLLLAYSRSKWKFRNHFGPHIWSRCHTRKGSQHRVSTRLNFMSACKSRICISLLTSQILIASHHQANPSCIIQNGITRTSMKMVMNQRETSWTGRIPWRTAFIFSKCIWACLSLY